MMITVLITAMAASILTAPVVAEQEVVPARVAPMMRGTAGHQAGQAVTRQPRVDMRAMQHAQGYPGPMAGYQQGYSGPMDGFRQTYPSSTGGYQQGYPGPMSGYQQGYPGIMGRGSQGSPGMGGSQDWWPNMMGGRQW